MEARAMIGRRTLLRGLFSSVAAAVLTPLPIALSGGFEIPDMEEDEFGPFWTIHHMVEGDTVNGIVLSGRACFEDEAALEQWLQTQRLRA